MPSSLLGSSPYNCSFRISTTGRYCSGLKLLPATPQGKDILSPLRMSSTMLIRTPQMSFPHLSGSPFCQQEVASQAQCTPTQGSPWPRTPGAHILSEPLLLVPHTTYPGCICSWPSASSLCTMLLLMPLPCFLLDTVHPPCLSFVLYPSWLPGLRLLNPWTIFHTAA